MCIFEGNFGGRDRDRTGDPLLAKRAVENTKWLLWCRLHGKPAKFPLLKYTEVVPSPTSVQPWDYWNLDWSLPRVFAGELVGVGVLNR